MLLGDGKYDVGRLVQEDEAKIKARALAARLEGESAKARRCCLKEERTG
jgi:hypothetical protein